eukprot:COSAG05_NODE_22322_length_265_cov_1.240964_1_plen_57_part_10
MAGALVESECQFLHHWYPALQSSATIVPLSACEFASASIWVVIVAFTVQHVLYRHSL